MVSDVWESMGDEGERQCIYLLHKRPLKNALVHHVIASQSVNSWTD
jgi:hypothetical protein